MNGHDQFLGVVQNGTFHLLMPRQGEARLTTIQMQEAQSPEMNELDLTEYEGKAIMVRGYDGGGWIYSAGVIDQAGPILTMVVQQLFGRADKVS